MKVGDLDIGTLRSIIRDEHHKSNTELKTEMYKHLKNNFMSKGDCLSFHQGRTSRDDLTDGNGSLAKAKLKFWVAITGLVTVVTTLVGVGIVVVSKWGM